MWDLILINILLVIYESCEENISAKIKFKCYLSLPILYIMTHSSIM